MSALSSYQWPFAFGLNFCGKWSTVALHFGKKLWNFGALHSFNIADTQTKFLALNLVHVRAWRVACKTRSPWNIGYSCSTVRSSLVQWQAPDRKLIHNFTLRYRCTWRTVWRTRELNWRHRIWSKSTDFYYAPWTPAASMSTRTFRT
jgi:hypothetical protein